MKIHHNVILKKLTRTCSNKMKHRLLRYKKNGKRNPECTTKKNASTKNSKRIFESLVHLILPRRLYLALPSKLEKTRRACYQVLRGVTYFWSKICRTTNQEPIRKRRLQADCTKLLRYYNNLQKTIVSTIQPEAL